MSHKRSSLHSEARWPFAMASALDVTTVDGAEQVVVVGRMAAVERRSLGQRVGSVAAYRNEIISPLDLLFTGY